MRAVIDAVQQLSSFKFVPTEYVRIDRTRVRANDARAIAHDRSVRAVLDAADRLSLFVPTHISQLLCDYARPGKAQHRLSCSVALKSDGSLVSGGYDGFDLVTGTPYGADFDAGSGTNSISQILRTDATFWFSTISQNGIIVLFSFSVTIPIGFQQTEDNPMEIQPKSMYCLFFN